MKLYANGILLNAAAQSVTLEKSRGDAAATLTAVLLTAAADRYFPKESLDGGGALFGTLAGVSPLTVRVGGCEVSEGLFRPAGMSLRAEDVGRTLALLPCEEGFLLLFFVE